MTGTTVNAARPLMWVSHLVPYPPVAGVLLRAHNLLKAVAGRHEVHLAAFVQPIWLETCFGSVDAGLQRCRQELERYCASVRFLPIERATRPFGQHRTALSGLLRGESYMERWLAAPGAHAVFRQLARERDYALVHFDTISLAPFREHFPSAVCTLGHHNVESQLLARRAQNAGSPLAAAFYGIEARRVAAYERRMAPAFASHVTCSDLDSARLSAVAPGVVTTTVPNGVDCEYFAPLGSAERSSSLAFVGTMNWLPNVDAMTFLLREIWPSLVRRVPGVTLDIVGSNPPAALRALAGNSPGVTVHGFVDDVRPILDSAALVVCPIRDGGGTKLKILDAFAMRKCVLAHPVAVEGIDATEGENVVFAEDPDDWCRAIAELLGDPERRRRLGLAAGRLASERYSFAAFGERLAAHFAELIRESGAR